MRLSIKKNLFARGEGKNSFLAVHVTFSRNVRDFGFALPGVKRGSSKISRILKISTPYEVKTSCDIHPYSPISDMPDYFPWGWLRKPPVRVWVSSVATLARFRGGRLWSRPYCLCSWVEAAIMPLLAPFPSGVDQKHDSMRLIKPDSIMLCSAMALESATDYCFVGFHDTGPPAH